MAAELGYMRARMAFGRQEYGAALRHLAAIDTTYASCDHSAAVGVKFCSIQWVCQGGNQAARTVPRQECVRIQRNDVPNL